eukprot:4663304-Alexandrium_andersonii.AAC.1
MSSQSGAEDSEDPVQSSNAILSEEPLLAGVSVGGWGGQTALLQQATRSGMRGPSGKPSGSAGLCSAET